MSKSINWRYHQFILSNLSTIISMSSTLYALSDCKAFRYFLYRGIILLRIAYLSWVFTDWPISGAISYFLKSFLTVWSTFWCIYSDNSSWSADIWPLANNYFKSARTSFQMYWPNCSMWKSNDCLIYPTIDTSAGSSSAKSPKSCCKEAGSSLECMKP